MYAEITNDNNTNPQFKSLNRDDDEFALGELDDDWEVDEEFEVGVAATVGVGVGDT